MAKMLQDQDGNVSSKRINGTLLLWIGIIMGVITWAVAIFHPLGNARAAMEIVAIFIGMGGGLDAAGIFDGVFKK
jgi:hypothetical protein